MAPILVPLLQLISAVFLGRAILSWFRIGPDSALYPISQLVHRLTEPVLARIRRIMPRTGRIDLSVLVVLVFISLVLTPIASLL